LNLRLYHADHLGGHFDRFARFTAALSALDLRLLRPVTALSAIALEFAAERGLRNAYHTGNARLIFFCCLERRTLLSLPFGQVAVSLHM